MEATGRAKLLHAVCTILEYLPWREARIFHNLTMIKIEQDRIGWHTDFLLLANQFLDKKVRQNLRLTIRRPTSGNRISQRASYSHKNHGKEFGMNNFTNETDMDEYLYSRVCKQWNNGFCSFGERCRKQHECWSCAKEGKMGESHRATAHGNCTSEDRQDDNSSTRGRQDDQYM